MTIKSNILALCAFLLSSVCGGCVIIGSAEIEGIIPIYPAEAALGATLAADKQPTFIWEDKAVNSYDFIISEAIKEPRGRYGQGKVIHEVTGIKGNAYTMPFELQTGKCYKWSVRETGQAEWSSRVESGFAVFSVVFKTWNKVSHGYTIYIEDPEKVYKYHLRDRRGY